MIGDSKKEIDFDKDKIDFAVVCGTAWNLLGTEAWIESRRKNGLDPHGIIYVREHRKTGFSIGKESLTIDDHNIIVEKEKDDFDERILERLIRRIKTIFYIITWKESSKSKKTINILCPGGLEQSWIIPLKKYQKTIKVEFIIIDDGLMNTVLQGSKIGIPYRALVQRLMMQKFHTTDRRLSVCQKNDPEYARSVVNDYVSVYKRFGSNIPDEVIETYRDAVLVCTQPYDALNGEDMIIYEKLILILRSLGIKSILRTHPREKDAGKYEKMGYIVDDSRRGKSTIEAVLANVEKKPKCVISISSSALNNCKLFFGIKPISLCRLVSLNKIDKDALSTLKRFMTEHKGDWLMPGDYDELKEMLTEIK